MRMPRWTLRAVGGRCPRWFRRQNQGQDQWPPFWYTAPTWPNSAMAGIIVHGTNMANRLLRRYVQTQAIWVWSVRPRSQGVLTSLHRWRRSKAPWRRSRAPQLRWPTRHIHHGTRLSRGEISKVEERLVAGQVAEMMETHCGPGPGVWPWQPCGPRVWIMVNQLVVNDGHND